MFLSAYSSLSSYEAYEALTDKTKLNKRKYQETISPPWQETWGGQVLPYTFASPAGHNGKDVGYI